MTNESTTVITWEKERSDEMKRSRRINQRGVQVVMLKMK